MYCRTSVMPAMARIPKRRILVRLDLEELAKKDLGGYHAIDPKDLEESELLYRIIDEEDPMPPEDFGKTLSKKGTGDNPPMGIVWCRV